MKQLAVWLVIFGSCCLSIRSAAQVAVPFKAKNGDSISTVYIWHSDTLREVQKDSVSIQSLFGHVKLQSNKTFFIATVLR